MSFDRFTDYITSSEELASMVGMPSAIAVRKELKTLAAEMPCDQVQLPDYDVAKRQTLLDGAYKNNLY